MNAGRLHGWVGLEILVDNINRPEVEPHETRAAEAGVGGVAASPLPAVNACLNAAACLLLCTGLFLIKRGRRSAHAGMMLAATLVSAAFLTCYLTYHLWVVPKIGHTPFRGQGVVRIAYYSMLVSHVFLAAVTVPMVLVTLSRARRRDWKRHRRIARWTWPIWFYVSVTGVLVYLALYRWNPQA